MKFKLIYIITFCLSSVLFAQYNGGNGSGYSAGSTNAVKLSAFLQGPFSGGSMTTTLNLNNFIPLNQPYNTSPWNYPGTEIVSSIPSGVVDWVLVELRTGTGASTAVQKRSCFILDDGSIVDLDGISAVKFDKTNGNNYYVVIRHRNHLAIMSANTLTLSSSLDGVYLTGGSTEYNFSTAQTQAYGSAAMKDVGGGVLGMISGDTNNSNIITAADKSIVNSSNLANGYYIGDTNFSGIVTAADKININSNNLKQSFVP
jgi:hypothetical protein